MQARRFHQRLRRAFAFLAVLGILLSGFHVAAGHSPSAMADAQASGHAGVLSSADHDHGHSHEGDEPEAQASGDHAHGHNPTDHIHETASLASGLVFSERPFGLALIVFEPQLLDPGLHHLLDRPPRVVAA